MASSYLYWNGTEWIDYESIGLSVGSTFSMRLDSNANAYIGCTYSTQIDNGSGYYYFDQGLWLLNKVAVATTGYSTYNTQMVIDQSDKFHFAFTEYNASSMTYKLNYVKPVADSWEIQTVEDRDSTYLMYFTLDNNDNPLILYEIQSQSILARLENDIWKKVLLPYFWSAGIALEVDGNPTICYTDSTIKCIKVINDNIETITDFQGGQIISMAIDSQSNIYILYTDQTKQLKYVEWNGSTLVDEHVVAKNVNSAAIALDKNDKPVIVYGQGCDVLVGHWSNTN